MNWRKRDLAQEEVKALSEKYGCDPLTASILLRRGIRTGEEIRYYLENDLRYLRDPFDLPGMEDAVERILAAKEEGEKVLVYGDVDADGITGTALLTDFLRRGGFDVSWDLPGADEPYGLSRRAVEEFAAAYGTLIITVDCGISNAAEIARAAELGVGVVVTDHHNPPEVLPEADALVNPKLPGRYPFKELSGCAVACKLVSALRFAARSGVYGQAICLLNVRPSNDSVVIETVKLRNLAQVDTLAETIVPGAVKITNTRLPAFLAGQQILCWDLPTQTKLLAQAFGKGVEIQMLDIAEEVGRVIPQTAGKSLLRLRELSKIGKYRGQSPGELDVLANLFVSFVQKKENLFDEETGADLQLAALGTIADIMPLRDENRLIVKKGLESMEKKPRPGLSDLLFKQGLAGRPLNAADISWQLTPVINAAGRLGDPKKAVSLLLGGTAEERENLAREITAMNGERKRLVEELSARAEAEARKSMETYSGNMAVFIREGTLPGESRKGVTGLIAGRLAAKLNVPSMVLSIIDNDIKGSLRSARDYPLGFFLEQFSGLFYRHGGHDFAAGFNMERANWDSFLKQLKVFTANMELSPESEKALEIDAEIPLAYLSRFEDDPRVQGKKEPYLLRLADRFEPYGERNRSLMFLSRGLKIADINLMGKEELKHVKLLLDAGKHKWPAVYWNAAARINVDFKLGDTVDLVYTVNRNWFNGAETPQIMVVDLKVPQDSR
ncbi:MAG: single-stranded-DNA-specific exonuclease RecJ [Treponema sp.]|jgi:single-stranded-DNA-specific exonuclease|nr:single-stranded-DNA-specific exonuclease RecJ [Treponema sp.]